MNEQYRFRILIILIEILDFAIVFSLNRSRIFLSDFSIFFPFLSFFFQISGMMKCHAPLPKIRGNGVATRVGDVYTRGKYPTYTR